jgi:hypothetical protein
MSTRIVSVIPRVIPSTLVILLFAAIFVAPVVVLAPHNQTALIFVGVVALFLLLFPIFYFVTARNFQQARQAAANRDDARTHVVPVAPQTLMQPVIEARVMVPQWVFLTNGISTGMSLLVLLGIVALRPIALPNWLYFVGGSILSLSVLSTLYNLAFQLDRSVYAVRTDDAGLTVARRWTKRFIPWSDIHLVYDVAASHSMQSLYNARMLWPYFTNDALLYESFIYRRMIACYEVASAQTRVLIPFLSQDAISQYGPTMTAGNRTALRSNSLLSMRRLYQPRFDDYSTFPQRMSAILATIVERSQVEVRARNP